MNTLSYKTVSANSKTVDKKWLLVDVTGNPLGRSASIIASLLRGKHKTNYTPHVDCGDNVIVINAEKIVLTGQKWSQKQYIRHTGYPGGQKSLSADQIHKKNNTKLIEKAIKGMLPKNKLGAELFRNLRVYSGNNHEHDSQNPTTINLKGLL
ncbi:MAG: 50S ribosomal protein L13 [Flavobacteriaceae bacterium TMED116]|nr:MAG: 50S ribosomal protein L13 [Flavobacteriaceae bacterium TMED116]